LKLQTQIPFKKQDNNLIDYNSKILLLGSCFVENIGEKLDYFKFQSTVNPYGILFHPIAIKNCVNFSIDKKNFSDQDIFFHNELWHCFDTHSDLSSTSKENLLNNLNEAIKLTNKHISNSTHIVITLGTAWVYSFLESNVIVANCHKLPQNQFKKELLSVSEIKASLEIIQEKIRLVNANATIIFTVSPVRHLKDGFVQNTQSKAHLITAIHEVLSKNNRTFYFPSYEMMMDELRDYRFYKEDMIHPNATAVSFIWEKFIEEWMSPVSENTMKDVDVVRKGLLHKPFNPEAKAHLQFLKNLKEKQKMLYSHFSHIEF